MLLRDAREIRDACKEGCHNEHVDLKVIKGTARELKTDAIKLPCI